MRSPDVVRAEVVCDCGQWAATLSVGDVVHTQRDDEGKCIRHWVTRYGAYFGRPPR